jgi:hypothetical protein
MSLPSENDNTLVNNILNDIQETENNPESVFNRQMDDMINQQQMMGGASPPFQQQMQMQQPQPQQQYSFVQDSVPTMMMPPQDEPMMPTKKPFNYFRYATMFLLFVIVFVGITHPKVYSQLNSITSLVNTATSFHPLNMAGTTLLAVIGGLIYLVLQHFII